MSSRSRSSLFHVAVGHSRTRPIFQHQQKEEENKKHEEEQKMEKEQGERKGGKE